MKRFWVDGRSVEHRTQRGEQDEDPVGVNTIGSRSLDDAILLVAFFQILWNHRCDIAMDTSGYRCGMI